VEQLPTTLGRLRVQTHGTGEAILFWPSLLMTADMWAGQVAELSADHRVILVDPPGHGGSEKISAPFTFDDCARCVVDVLDGLGIERAHFVGNSWGGMIGGTFAARHPERIGRTVLMNCTASPAGRQQRLEYGLLLRAAKMLGGIRGPLTGQVLKAFLGPTTFRDRPEVVNFVRDAVRRVDMHSSGWAVTSVVPRRPDQRALLSRVRTPVLVIAGSEDTTFPVAETLEMAAAIPGASSVVLDGVAHLAALESPHLVNALIKDFVAGA
jgi:3-oxoadipate enol-lactonase